MKVKLLGYRPLDYVSKKDNQRKIGTEIHYVKLDPEDNMVGRRVKSEYVKNLNTLAPQDINKEFDLFYDVDGYGRAYVSSFKEVIK